MSIDIKLHDKVNKLTGLGIFITVVSGFNLFILILILSLLAKG